LPDQLGSKIASYIKQIRHFQNLHKYRAMNIAAMDKTDLWLDMSGNTTLQEKGARTVAIKTTGHDRDRFTCILGARANGFKLPPLIVFKGKRKDKSLQNVTGIVVEMQENAWMSEELTWKWLRILWGGATACLFGMILEVIKWTVLRPVPTKSTIPT
jgi:hypothetical protein